MSKLAISRQKSRNVGVAVGGRVKPIRRWTSRLLALTLLVTGLSVLVSTSPTAAATVEEVLEEQLFAQLNQERATRGLAPFEAHNGLTAASRSWSATMSAQGSLYHSSDGRAEIIARGWWSGQITDAWMRSPGHRNLVVDPNLGWAGVGVTCDASGQVWATVQFYRIDRSRGTLASSAANPVATESSQGSDCGEQTSIDQVRRLYVAYFKRESDHAGLAYWVSRISDGAGLGQVSHSFASSPEFTSRYGSLNDRAFVRLVYVNVLEREPDEAGYSYWTRELDAGMSRGELMIGFSESGEFRYTTGIN